ncbi:MAG: GNAT family N-acetyltransferase [Chloroflexi bacterium]|nr:GNAT family N-acetyltransferase [Chloroflexota bacterium]
MSNHKDDQPDVPDASDIKRILDYDYPDIQKHLIEEAAKKASQETGEEIDPYEPYYTTDAKGQRILHMSFDSWWLREYDERDVLLGLPGISILHTQHWTAGSAAATIDYAYQREEAGCFSEEDILAHIERFPQGQFVAIRTGGPGAGNAVGMASAMRTSRPPTAPVLPWVEAIGDYQLAAHEPEGDWLYGVEVAVNPIYRRNGIGTALYKVRFDLARALNLRGWYAVGMLMGYHDYAEQMDVREYGQKVIAREIKDPTVTMQMNRGFRAVKVVTDYDDEPQAGDAGVLIVWENADYSAR